LCLLARIPISFREVQHYQKTSTPWKGCPYTVKGSIRRELIFSYETLWAGQERRQESMDIREEVLLRDGPICAACGGTFHESEVHVDHKKLRAKFKDPLEADHLDNQQILCNDCHRVKTESDLRTLSRMRR
jgi:5-methylcytosine-specific restriction endonuclease McrA